jgi:hypothetical protein
MNDPSEFVSSDELPDVDDFEFQEVHILTDDEITELESLNTDYIAVVEEIEVITELNFD